MDNSKDIKRLNSIGSLAREKVKIKNRLIYEKSKEIKIKSRDNSCDNSNKINNNIKTIRLLEQKNKKQKKDIFEKYNKIDNKNKINFEKDIININNENNEKDNNFENININDEINKMDDESIIFETSSEHKRYNSFSSSVNSISNSNDNFKFFGIGNYYPPNSERKSTKPIFKKEKDFITNAKTHKKFASFFSPGTNERKNKFEEKNSYNDQKLTKKITKRNSFLDNFVNLFKKSKNSGEYDRDDSSSCNSVDNFNIKKKILFK